MTPMIDVVFLLIVFFTLVINFVAADQDERVKLPISELAQPPEQPPTEPMTIHAIANGCVIFDGKEQSLQELRKTLEHQIRILKYVDVPLDKATVIVRGDARCEIRQILDVMELCQELGLLRIDLRAKQKE